MTSKRKKKNDYSDADCPHGGSIRSQMSPCGPALGYSKTRTVKENIKQTTLEILWAISLVVNNYTGSHLFVNVMFIGIQLVIWSIANG